VKGSRGDFNTTPVSWRHRYIVLRDQHYSTRRPSGRDHKRMRAQTQASRYDDDCDTLDTKSWSAYSVWTRIGFGSSTDVRQVLYRRPGSSSASTRQSRPNPLLNSWKSRKRNLQVRPELDQQSDRWSDAYNEDRVDKRLHQDHDAGQPERHQSEGYDRSERDIHDLDCGRRDNYKSMYGLWPRQRIYQIVYIVVGSRCRLDLRVVFFDVFLCKIPVRNCFSHPIGCNIAVFSSTVVIMLIQTLCPSSNA
jgi:hypothetical protein